jgi:recombination protein U
MTIRYPNGKKYEPVVKTDSATKRRAKQSNISFSNRGKSLEDDLNDTNSYYLSTGIANIHKKPVPIQIVKVEYPSRSAAVIREGYFRTPSTTDYNGVWNGYYIDFEAKETENKTSFPLKNIHLHQMNHMQSVIKQRGIAFFIIRFSTLNRDFLVPFSVINEAWKVMEHGGRKSITLDTIETESIEIPLSYTPRIDYLTALRTYLNIDSL